MSPMYWFEREAFKTTETRDVGLWAPQGTPLLCSVFGTNTNPGCLAYFPGAQSATIYPLVFSSYPSRSDYEPSKSRSSNVLKPSRGKHETPT